MVKILKNHHSPNGRNPAVIKFLIIKGTIALASLIFVKVHLNRKIKERPVIDHIHKAIVLKLPYNRIKLIRPTTWRRSYLPCELAKNDRIAALRVYASARIYDKNNFPLI